MSETSPRPADLETVILCGGRGTRAFPDTVQVPKPLLEVGGAPMVEHVMGVFAGQGCRRFLLATGYRQELFTDRYGQDGRVRALDTGLDTDTGERVARAAPFCSGDRFFLTYGDGVGDVDLDALLAFHLSRPALVTVTTVPLPSPYGTLSSDASGRVTHFHEKPRLDDHWINAGFFVVERTALEHWRGANLETDVLPDLARRGSLFAYRHRGFWKSMDTFKDRQELQALAGSGRPPWGPPLSL
jgi:glucose-1-phosphate cytidylyltransferase